MKGKAIAYLGILLLAGTVFCQEAKQGPQPPAGGEMACPQMGQGMQQGDRRMMRHQAGCPCTQQGMMGSGMQHRGMMGQQMGPMRNMAPQASMVTSDNGGVIILSGNRLLKFDKNLKLIKEVEVFPRDKQEMPGMHAPADKK